jgi:hypothetical protein
MRRSGRSPGTAATWSSKARRAPLRARGEAGASRDWVFVQLGDGWYVRERGFKLTSEDALMDMSGAPFSEKVSKEADARARLKAVLDALNPGGGRTVPKAAGKKPKGVK